MERAEVAMVEDAFFLLRRSYGDEGRAQNQVRMKPKGKKAAEKGRGRAPDAQTL